MFTEDQLLPISAMQHLLFCPRQCALIHLEQVWAENRFTVEGQHLHKKAHAEGKSQRSDVRTTRGLALRSYRLGIIGKADIVEFVPLSGSDAKGRRPPPVRGQPQDWFNPARWTVRPVEYKRGKPKANDCDRVQLCAQAICLEEMLGAQVTAGDLFYGRNRRRTEVAFDAERRGLTASVAARLHALIDARITPLARREKKCDTCSLLPLCLPDAMGVRSMAAAADRAFSRHLLAIGPETDLAPKLALD